MRVGITASRRLSPAGRRRIRETVARIVDNPKVEAITFGGARGGDTVALEAALAHRKGTRPWLRVILPGTLDDQPIETHPVTTRADEIRELRLPITADDGFAAYRVRNKAIVDENDFLVAFSNGDPASGTAMTTRLARDAKKSYRVIDCQAL